MIYGTNKELRKWLREGGWWTYTLLPFFVFSRASFDRALQEVSTQHKDLSRPCARAAYRLLTFQKRPIKINWMRAWVVLWMLLVLLLLNATRGHAQTAVNIDRVGGVKQTSDTFKVNCTVGCSAGASFADNTAFAPGTTSISVTGYEVDDVGTTACTENSACAPRMNTSRIPYVDLSKSAANVNKFLVTADPITFASPQHVIADASAAVIGHVIADTGSTTVVTGNVAVTNAGLTNIDVALSTRTKPADQQHVLLDANSGVDIGKLTANQSVNVAQVNGVATSTGTGVMGTGVQRIAIASDNDPLIVKQATAGNLNATVVGTGTFVTQSTLAAETTKVIGTVRLLGNSGAVLDAAQNAAVAPNSVLAGCNFTTAPASLTSGNQGAAQCNSKGELLTQLTDGTTNVAVIAATTALKTDLSSVAGTATSTAAAGVQLVGIEGRAGTSMETTAGVLDSNLKNVNNAAVATAASGIQKVGIVGGAAGANVDGAAAGTLPANVIMAGTIENNLPGRILQCDKSAQVVGAAAATTAIVAASGSTTIYVCSVTIQGAGAAGTARLIYGTGATCGTGPVNITPAWNTQLQSATVSAILQFGDGSLGYLFKTIASQALCITMATASATTNVFVTYAQF